MKFVSESAESHRVLSADAHVSGDSSRLVFVFLIFFFPPPFKHLRPTRLCRLISHVSIVSGCDLPNFPGFLSSSSSRNSLCRRTLTEFSVWSLLVSWEYLVEKSPTERETSFPGVKTSSCRIHKVGRQVCSAASLQRGENVFFQLLTLSVLSAHDTRVCL